MFALNKRSYDRVFNRIGILDCPNEARKKLKAAEERMNRCREYAARQNNKLDEPGGRMAINKYLTAISIFLLIACNAMAYAGEHVYIKPSKMRIEKVIGHRGVSRDLLTIVLDNLHVTNTVSDCSCARQRVSLGNLNGYLELIVDKKRKRPFYEGHDIECFVSGVILKVDLYIDDGLREKTLLEEFWNKISSGCRYVTFECCQMNGSAALISDSEVRGGWRIALYAESLPDRWCRMCLIMNRTRDTKEVTVDVNL